jgi:hypothetical protein
MIADIRLRKFDMRSVKSGSVVVLIGKRNTGKSFLVRDMLFHNQDIPIGTVISGTEGANEFYSHIVPSLYIYHEYTPQIIDNVIKRQHLVQKEMKHEIARKGHTNIDPRAFLILDDCLYDTSWTKDKNVRYLFQNGRHISETVLITLQYSMGIPPSFRTNVDYIFILRENIISNRKRLYEQYAGMFPSFEIYNQVMDQCTENYECLVINNNAKSNKLEDQVFWYKAVDHGDFRVGASEYWEYHTRHNDDSSDDEFQEFDPRDPNASKKGSRINVHKGM